MILAAIGAAYYLAEEPYVSTDDAFVRAAKESINARVAGQVVKIAVKDNQRVQRGDLLFQVDPEPYQIAVEQAEAQLGGARLQINEIKATYRQQVAKLQSASATATSTSVSMDEGKRSSLTVGRRARCLTKPT